MTISIGYLKSLQARGFEGHRLLDRHGRVTTLEYRRVWRGVVDVVLVFGEDDAEAYRGDDRIASEDPLAIAWQPQLALTAFGTVAEVVTKVLSWPVAPGWSPAVPAPDDGRAQRPAMTTPQNRPGEGRLRNGEQT